MKTEHTARLSPDAPGLARAATLLEAGALVAFPTETVYGLGADARNPKAVAAIFAAKDRPSFNPLIVHVSDFGTAAEIGDFSPRARDLAQAFWPGPLTLVVPLRDKAGISDLVTAGLDSIAIRIPEHPVAQGVLRTFGGPVAAPSANPSGRISATSADHVLDGLEGRIAAVVDGGACPVGVESTILGMTDAPTLLRPGGLPLEALSACLGRTPAPAAPVAARPSAPGQLASHYAPDARVLLDIDARVPGHLWLGFGPRAKEADLNLSASGDLTEAATNLFSMLRQMDARATPEQIIAVAPIPEHGLGLAINDRLRRAAAPR